MLTRFLQRSVNRLALPGWLVLSLGLVVCFILSPAWQSLPAKRLQLGTDLPMLALIDPLGTRTIEEVAATPETDFTLLDAPLNKGYTRDVYWLKIPAPYIAAGKVEPEHDPLWLEILPSYLDQVTLYQRSQGTWQERRSGDAARDTQRVHVRQLVFPLLPGEPLILRVQTSSPMQVDATIWRSSGLMTQFSAVEWASGLHQGINLMLALLIIGAALALRLRNLAAMAVAAMAVLVHGASDRGYLQVWLPPQLAPWGDLCVSLGTLMLPAALAWQMRELLTRNTRWRRMDQALLALGVIPLLCLPAIPLGRYQDWAWIGVGAPWAISALFAVVAWSNLLRERATLVHVLMVVPSTMYGLMGLYVTAAYVGLASLPTIETSVFWQLNTLLVNIVITVAVGASLIQKFRDSMARQAQLLESLARSEHALEERVRLRTAELLRAQNALQAALHSERSLRLEQRQFFNMVNHEFRTPLAVVDSAATEQLSFPSPDIESQLDRAAQIRRACRRLTALVDNCLISDRLDAPAFRLQLHKAPVMELVDDAVQLVHWSRRHHLRLDSADAPTTWECDSTLTRIALSNLVDNAVKYAQAGEIAVCARTNVQGQLELSVSDQGPGLAPELAQRIFERFERGHRSDQARGFGLGLWVARRIARLHGGDIQAAPSAQGGTCFTLTLPMRPDPAAQAKPLPTASSNIVT
ncbi:Sensor protein KdpD [Delftia tsuruhatensis]|uniref:sensor histidine kinase n=1 Tax=Delftia tsuruhatensis TaxID=180282 RepID=UPI001E745ACD|nr:ATP-binding protein [Delftia tsuruhatensis]CAB5695698.1 Sensor protein KdpD [Delftia tsuruhatensis]CAC9678240.1 Sensor protein KdpD [Delftia tsuruhatensis]